MKTGGNKIKRAEPFSQACEQGRVYIVRDMKHYDELLDELCTFPLSEHDM